MNAYKKKIKNIKSCLTIIFFSYNNVSSTHYMGIQIVIVFNDWKYLYSQCLFKKEGVIAWDSY